MLLTIQPCKAAGDTVFLVYDQNQKLRYRVTAYQKPTGAVLLVTCGDGSEAAKIKQRIFHPFLRYGIAPAAGKNLSVNLRLSSGGLPQQLLLGGVTWKLRGDLTLRSFDLIDVDSSVLLSHQKCWKDRQDCFTVEIHQEAFEIPLLCVCLCVDFITEGDLHAVVAIN